MVNKDVYNVADNDNIRMSVKSVTVLCALDGCEANCSWQWPHPAREQVPEPIHTSARKSSGMHTQTHIRLITKEAHLISQPSCTMRF